MDKILIVGGGPIGLALGVGMVNQGLPVTIIEKESDISPFPKASTIHPPTLEILHEWGLLGKAMEIGKVINRIQYWNRSSKRLIAEFSLDLLKEYTPYPYRLHFDQQFLSRLFLEYLQGNELASVNFNTELVDLSQDSDGVNALIRRNHGEEVEDRYSYLIGADGLSSTVRKRLGISFTGHTNPHYHLLMGLKNYKISSEFPNLAPVAMFLDPVEWVDMITNPDMLKVIIPMTQDRSEEIDEHFVRAKMKEVGILEDQFDIFYKTIYKTHQLVADKIIDNRVVLIGDAAHVNVEFGGMGMNSGIHDAYLLVDKMVKIFNGEDRIKHFEDFANKRIEITKEIVQKDTIKNTNLIQNVTEHERELKDIVSSRDKSIKYLLRTSMIEGYRLMFEENLNYQS